MLRHLCLLAAAATAAQPQNATRQLDAYEPPPTDLSRACASCERAHASRQCRGSIGGDREITRDNDERSTPRDDRTHAGRDPLPPRRGRLDQTDHGALAAVFI